MIRRVGEPVKRGQAYRHRPGAYAILLRGRDVLLTWQHGDDIGLQLPGGGIDPGEQPVAALHREVFEETGWRIARPRRLGAFRRLNFMPDYGYWAEKVCHIYLAHPVRPHGPPREEGHTALWMPLEVAAERLDERVGKGFVATLLR